MAQRSPEAAKERILTHMNKDHGRSLVLYLRHFSKLPYYHAQDARMEDITNDQMVIRSSSGQHVIPLDPPMKSMSEARERLVAMHKEALKGLGLEEIVMDRYVPPDGPGQWLLCALCLLILGTFPFQDALMSQSNSLIYQIWSVGGAVPQLADLCHLVAPYVWWFIVVVHSLESGVFTQRIQKFHVEAGSITWFLWILDCIVEGAGCTMRFERLVKQKAEKDKHT